MDAQAPLGSVLWSTACFDLSTQSKELAMNRMEPPDGYSGTDHDYDHQQERSKGNRGLSLITFDPMRFGIFSSQFWLQ
jgi:hypothetical protein